MLALFCTNALVVNVVPMCVLNTYHTTSIILSSPCKPKNSLYFWNRIVRNSAYSLLGPASKSAQRRICLNFLPSPMLLRNQIKLLNQWLRDISLVLITWPVFQFLCLPVFRDEKPLHFLNQIWLKHNGSHYARSMRRPWAKYFHVRPDLTQSIGT